METDTRDTLRAAVLVALAGLALMALIRGGAAVLRETPPPEPPRLHLIEPTGLLAEAPARFRWEKIPEAETYRLTLEDDATIWPLAVREIPNGAYIFNETERRSFSAPRKYRWQVEALAADGETVIARGHAFFGITPVEDAASSPSPDAQPPPAGPAPSPSALPGAAPSADADASADRSSPERAGRYAGRGPR